ncbi:MAG: hypothetical protein PWQ51_1122 [Methanolobus sp.]|jgi:hypothetical protein|nr:hypothetical protein [Methanolobus sp.]
MIKKIGLILIIMMLFAGCAMAGENNEKEKNPYKVTFLKPSDYDTQNDDIAAKLVYATITQGETDWHSQYISYYSTTLDVTLNWGDPSDSLKLTIYTPDSDTLGPYYDGDDGLIDGKIGVRIRDSNGIETGTWYYRVYGQSVSGTETYSI